MEPRGIIASNITKVLFFKCEKCDINTHDIGHVLISVLKWVVVKHVVFSIKVISLYVSIIC